MFFKRVCLEDKLFAIAEEVVRRLDVDPKKVLISTRQTGTRFEPSFEDYMQMTCRSLMTRPTHDPRVYKKYRATYHIMPFEVSEISKSRTQVKLFWQTPAGLIEEITLFPKRDGTVNDLFREASRYYPYTETGSRKFRLLQIAFAPLCNQRVFQVYNENMLIGDIDQRQMYKQQMLNVRLEEVPIDEIDITPGEFLCPVVHFDREPAKIFGISFVIKIRSNELMTDVRDRLRKKLHDVSDAEFTKYKFALLSKEKLQLCRYIEFNNGEKVNLADMSNHTTGGPQVYIGIDHKAPVLHSNEAAIRILN